MPLNYLLSHKQYRRQFGAPETVVDARDGSEIFSLMQGITSVQ